jgi:hypothetical protein
VKKSWNGQNHLALRRRGAVVEKKTKRSFILNLCVSASLHEILYFSHLRSVGATPRQALPRVFHPAIFPLDPAIPQAYDIPRQSLTSR